MNIPGLLISILGIYRENCVAYCLLLCYFCIDIAASNTLLDDFKYHTKRQVIENSHLTLVCPDLEKESLIQWFKDDTFLNSSFRNNMGYGEEPHITIDAYNSLYILRATKGEEGTYSCKVDGDNVMKYYVKIVSKSNLLNQDFIRFSMYLGFVLSITITCYCAGICLAWHRRASFADPLNLYNKGRPY